MEILFIVIFAHLRRVRTEKLQKTAEAAASRAKEVLPVEAMADKAKVMMSTIAK